MVCANPTKAIIKKKSSQRMASLIVSKTCGSRDDKAVLAKLPTQLVSYIFSFLPHKKLKKNEKNIQLKLLDLNVYERECLRRQCRAFREVLLLELCTTFPHPNYKSLYSLLAHLHQLAQTAPEKTPDCILLDEGVHYFLGEDVQTLSTENETQVQMQRSMGSINYSVCLMGRGRGNTIIHCCDENIIVRGIGLHVEIRDLTIVSGCFNISSPPLLKEEEKSGNALEVKSKKATLAQEEGCSFMLENIGVYCMSRFGLKASNVQGTCQNVHMYGEVSEGIWITNGSMVTLCESATSTRDPPYNDDYVFHVDPGSKLRVLLPLTIFDCYYTQDYPVVSEDKMFFGGGGVLEHVDSSMKVFSSFTREQYTEGDGPIKQLRRELNIILNEKGYYDSMERHFIEAAIVKKKEDAINEGKSIGHLWDY